MSLWISGSAYKLFFCLNMDLWMQNAVSTHWSTKLHSCMLIYQGLIHLRFWKLFRMCLKFLFCCVWPWIQITRFERIHNSTFLSVYRINLIVGILDKSDKVFLRYFVLSSSLAFKLVSSALLQYLLSSMYSKYLASVLWLFLSFPFYYRK